MLDEHSKLCIYKMNKLHAVIQLFSFLLSSYKASENAYLCVPTSFVCVHWFDLLQEILKFAFLLLRENCFIEQD